jgi:ABC-type sugar transport system substrate-binding protein
MDVKSHARSRCRRWSSGAVLLAVVLTLVLAACGGDDDDDAAGEPAPTAGETDTGAEKIQLEPKTIGIMGPVDAAEIIKLANDATEQAAEALGWEVVRVDPGGDPAEMASGMTSLVNQGVDAIVLTTMEPATIASGLRAAEDAGIPVIDTHTLTQSADEFDGEYFLPPDEEFELLLDRMQTDVPEGSQIGVINLPQFLNAQIAGENIAAAAPDAGWEIVASHDADLANLVPDTQRAVGDMLRANPDIDAIFGCCDFVPPGAVPAIRQAGSDIKVYALHGIPSVMPQVESGLAVVEVADYQKGGVVAIDVLANHFATGAEIPKEMPSEFGWEMTIVDESNVAEGYPYPTEEVLAPFLERWAEMYEPAS